MTYKEDREKMFQRQEEWADAASDAVHHIVDFARFQAKLGDLFAGALSLLHVKLGDVIHIDAEDYVKVVDGTRFSYIVTIQPTDDGGCDIIFTTQPDPDGDE